MLAGWIRLLARFMRHRASRDADPGPLRAPTLAQLPAAFVEGLSGLLPFLALSGGFLWISVWFLLIYAVLDLLEGGLPLMSSAD